MFFALSKLFLLTGTSPSDLSPFPVDEQMSFNFSFSCSFRILLVLFCSPFPNYCPQLIVYCSSFFLIEYSRIVYPLIKKVEVLTLKQRASAPLLAPNHNITNKMNNRGENFGQRPNRADYSRTTKQPSFRAPASIQSSPCCLMSDDSYKILN